MIQIAPTKNNICAVIISHDPGEDFITNLKSIATQLAEVAIVNNGSEKFTSDFLKGFEEKVYLITNSENLGQGKALNQGVSWAILQGYQWLLLLDQDSLLNSSISQELITAFQNYPQRQKLKMIGSNCIYKNIKELKYKKECQEKLYFKRDVVMMSGSLLSASAYNKVGSFREEFFIDSIDADYCLRLRKEGFRIIVACKAQMTHSVGKEATMRRFFWKRFLVTNHNHIRCYYMTRNGLILVKEYFFREPYWVLRRIIWYFLVKPGLIILFEKNKIPKLKSMFLGAAHAIIDKTGTFEK